MFIGVDNKAKIINQIFVGVDGKAKLIYSGNGSGSFELPTFTGSHSVFGDEKSGRIEIYESGTLVLNKGTYDFFLVGGGGGGGNRERGYSNPASGGGGGYTANKKDVKVDASASYQIVIGAGGIPISAPRSVGGETSVLSPIGEKFSANGGISGVYSATGSESKSTRENGGAGGSGGGGSGDISGGSGGVDGGNGNGGSGRNTLGDGGKGQGSTTRMFAENNSTLYASGGSGGKQSPGGAGTANSGNGGNAANDNNASSAGAGGSGIVIIRWNNT